MTINTYGNLAHWSCVLLSTILALLPRILGKSFKSIKTSLNYTAENLKNSTKPTKMCFDNPITVDETQL